MQIAFRTLGDMLAAIGKSSVAASVSGTSVCMIAVISAGFAQAAAELDITAILRTIIFLPIVLFWAFLASLFLTVPASTAATVAFYPLALRFNGANVYLLAACGFLVGFLEWSILLTLDLTIKSIQSWLFATFFGGLAGTAGGVAFAKHLLRHTLAPKKAA